MRRYELAQVYLQNSAAPKWLAAIDIVRAGTDHAVGRDAPMLAEAELIRMVCDVCQGVEALKGCNIDIQLSHASLLVAVLDHVGVDDTVLAGVHVHQTRGERPPSDAEEQAVGLLLSAASATQLTCGAREAFVDVAANRCP
jgi:hypothetical protein